MAASTSVAPKLASWPAHGGTASGKSTAYELLLVWTHGSKFFSASAQRGLSGASSELSRSMRQHMKEARDFHKQCLMRKYRRACIFDKYLRYPFRAPTSPVLINWEDWEDFERPKTRWRRTRSFARAPALRVYWERSLDFLTLRDKERIYPVSVFLEHMLRADMRHAREIFSGKLANQYLKTTVREMNATAREPIEHPIYVPGFSSLIAKDRFLQRQELDQIQMKSDRFWRRGNMKHEMLRLREEAAFGRLEGDY
jgi:hypothetical protein